MSYAMEYFRSSGLKQLVESGKIDTIPPEDLVDIVAHYIKNRKKIESTQSCDKLSVFFKNISDDQLLTNSLFYNRIFLPDPIITDCGRAALLMPGFPPNKIDPPRILREKIKRSVDFYNLYSPLIDAGIIVPITTSNDMVKIPILIPQKNFSTCVPSQLFEFLKASTKVFSCLSAGPDGFVFPQKTGNNLQPSNTILIDILGEKRLYRLSCMKSFQPEATGDFQAVFEFAEKDNVREEEFRPWVEQSIFQTMQYLLESLQNSMQIASVLGCCYQTNSSCEKMILEKSCNSVENAPVNFLNVNLGNIKIFRPSEIARFREKNAKHFDNFQSSIQEISLDLKHLSKEDFETKANLILRNEIYPQVKNIREFLRGDIVSNSVSAAMNTALELCIVVATGASLTIASVLACLALGATLPVGQQIGKYYREKKTPEFIWSQLLK